MIMSSESPFEDPAALLHAEEEEDAELDPDAAFVNPDDGDDEYIVDGM